MLTYTVSMPEPHTHLFHVEVVIDAVASPHLDLHLPAWTPGSYMIREYARHVQEFSATGPDGQPLPWRKTAKAVWQVDTEGVAEVRVRYKVYAFEQTVRTSYLDARHGYFNPGNLCMYLPERSHAPLIMQVLPAEGWRVSTALEPDGSGPWCYRASDYDELVDSPCECGTQRVLTFSVDGIPHEIAIYGYGNEDEARLLRDTQRIVEAQRDMFGSLPYPHYLFILHLTDGRGGGLEHRNSVTNMVDRWSFLPERSYERYLSLTSHELFHVWNVKRLRPAALGPFDYSQENYTRLIWFVEGVTSYYDELLLVRGGLMQPERYLERLADEILNLQSQPGRLLQTLEESSFDAWIKYYRPDENSANTSISYYLKGALVSMLLDMQIRRVTEGAHCLDDVVRLLYQRYPISGPGIPEEGAVLAAVEEIAGEQAGLFRDFFAQMIAGTTELDYSSGLAVVGLELRWSHRAPRPDGSAPAWLGAAFKRKGERTLVSSVRADSPAYSAGVYAEDELVALNGWRVDEEQLQTRLAEYAPGSTVRLSLFRGDALIEVPVTLTAAPYDRLEVVAVASPTEQQRGQFQHWMGR
ncbi:peptidase M61 domain-containing protein [Oscillochloris trichoides DG-6]|uniref:Peptidase M61 domain-containing protein n=1 Tax=Oscillochloris trichoides DG-6 TaxID=765420 RepID=E1IFT5_9CHLR|nr:PDZ domain-containing protein [Oscillochloris trichoides]EFO79976.1 peptidase M61 domain-containing protein [Oscillochloris trichoides DG-6]